MIGSAWFNGKSLGIAQIWVPNKDLSKDSCVTPTPGVTVRFKSRGPNVYMPQNVSSFPSHLLLLYTYPAVPPCLHHYYVARLAGNLK